jgi:hypothetical protein
MRSRKAVHVGRVQRVHAGCDPRRRPAAQLILAIRWDYTRKGDVVCPFTPKFIRAYSFPGQWERQERQERQDELVRLQIEQLRRDELRDIRDGR